jgi:hypothetical protein
MEFIPISTLEGLSGTQPRYLKGVITLIWPFSSSTKKAAFLLAEPDFRLRHKKGQVRIQVHGAAALDVAKSKLGIGDEIVLSLRGARLVRAEQDVSTPGKSVDVELIYKSVLSMEVIVASNFYLHILMNLGFKKWRTAGRNQYRRTGVSKPFS